MEEGGNIMKNYARFSLFAINLNFLSFSKALAVTARFMVTEPEFIDVESDREIEDIAVLVGEEKEVPLRFGTKEKGRGDVAFDEWVRVDFHNTSPTVTAWCHDMPSPTGPKKVRGQSDMMPVKDKGQYIVTTTYDPFAYETDPQKGCKLTITELPASNLDKEIPQN